MLPRFAFILMLSLVATGPVRAAEAAGSGELLTLKTAEGEAFSAYRTGPRGARIGVLLIHESWGFDATVREWADWLGQNGYRVVAPDLYHNGEAATSRTQATAMAAALKQANANARYRAALRKLKAPGRKLVAMGWELGGAQAFQAALAAPNDIHAIVNYEGVLPGDSAVKNLKHAVLVITAKKGSAVPAEQLHAFEAAMKRQKGRFVIAYYDPDRLEPADRYYSGQAVQLVWNDTQAFFKRYVK